MEKRQAEPWEIVEVLYPDALDVDSANRFHSLMSSLKTMLNNRTWCTYSKEARLYSIDPDFARFYDGDEFKRLYALFQRHATDLQRFAIGVQLLKFDTPFAATLTGDAFDALRQYYEACRAEVVRQLGGLLPHLARQGIVAGKWVEKLLE